MPIHLIAVSNSHDYHLLSFSRITRTYPTGVNSFKAFLAYKGALMMEVDELYYFMKHCKQLGAVAMVHCEDGNLVYTVGWHLAY